MTTTMTTLGHACYQRMDELTYAADLSLIPMEKRQDVETWGLLTVAAHALGLEDAAEDDEWTGDVPPFSDGTAWDEHDANELAPY